jgi:hypothetical protein
MEREINTESAVNQSIFEINKLIRANSEAIVANAHRQTDILAAQTNLYKNTLLLVAVNLVIGLGILITAFISYSDKQEIATLHLQLRDRDEQVRLLQNRSDPSLNDSHLPVTANDAKK